MKKYAFIPSRDGKSETLSVLKEFLTSAGYDVKVFEESVALAYEGLVDNDLTGIAISMGAV